MKTSSERQRLDCQRSLAAQFFCNNFSREKRYLIILQRDLEKNSQAITKLGIEKAKEFQLYYDFQMDFERLKELMKEYSWSKEFLMENGINFLELRKLYFAIV